MLRDLVDEQFRIKPGTEVSVARHDPGWAQTEEMRRLGKADARKLAEEMRAQGIKAVGSRKPSSALPPSP
jgi:hypothetical protein